MSMAKTIFRILLFAIGLYACIQGVNRKEIALVLAGSLVAGLAFLAVTDIARPERGISLAFLARRIWPDTPLVFVILAVVCTAIAMLIVQLVPENLPAVLPWVLGMACMVLAAFFHDRNRQTGALSPPASSAPANAQRRARRDLWIEIGLVAALTAIAFALRIYDLENLPPIVHVDEGEMGMFGLDILAGKPIPFFYTAPFWGLPLIFNYLQAACMAIFGTTVFGLRMLSVIVGALCIPVLYGIGREGWGKVAGLVAAGLMCVSHYHIQYSRIAIICIESQLGMIVFAYLMARIANGKDFFGGWALPRGGLLMFVLAGLALGLSQYFYFGSRVMPFIAIGLLGYFWLARKISLKQAAAVFVVAAAVFAPLAVFFAGSFDLFINRIEFVSIFREQNYKAALGPDASLPADLVRLMGHQLERILGFFLKLGDGGGFYTSSISAFDELTSLLMWLGIGATITRLRRYPEFSLLVWFVFGLVMGGVFTIDAPSGQRLLIMTPVVYLFGGVLVSRVAGIFELLAGRIARPVSAALAIALIAFAGAANINTYFSEYPRIAAGYEAILAAREFMTAPAYHNYLLSAPVMYSNHGAIKFVARDANVKDLSSPEALQLLAGDGKGIAVVALQNKYGDLNRIRALYPAGVSKVVKDPAGREMYTVFRVPPAER